MRGDSRLWSITSVVLSLYNHGQNFICIPSNKSDHRLDSTRADLCQQFYLSFLLFSKRTSRRSQEVEEVGFGSGSLLWMLWFCSASLKTSSVHWDGLQIECEVTGMKNGIKSMVRIFSVRKGRCAYFGLE